MRVDVPYLKRESEKMNMQLMDMRQDMLMKTEEGKQLRKKYGNNANLNSPQQISYIFFKVMGYKLPDGKKSTDDAALIRIGSDFCMKLAKYRTLFKAKGTYIDNITRQAVHHDDGDYYIHPTFSLNLVSTFRSSSFDPNLQNIPIRDPETGKLVRSAFYPRRGFQLMEVDFSGAEVSCGCCYHEDPNMMAYLLDPDTNMHTDTAGDAFIMKPKFVSKPMRQATKTFVFGEFYGDWYEPQARLLWESMIREGFKLTNGTPAKLWLKKKGIKNLAQFTTHMKEVERIMWEDRFGRYQEWKDETWQFYIKHGYYHTKTGFTISGLLDKKQVCNSPIQGSAFHWLLWCLMKSEREAMGLGMLSYPVGQVHDSMIWDVHPSELDYLTEAIHRIMTKDIYERFPWINTPISADIDVSPIDCSWHEKKEYKL
jgi:DNA polymerase-1